MRASEGSRVSKTRGDPEYPAPGRSGRRVRRRFGVTLEFLPTTSAFQGSDPERGIFFNPRSPKARDRGHPPPAHRDKAAMNGAQLFKAQGALSALMSGPPALFSHAAREPQNLGLARRSRAGRPSAQPAGRPALQNSAASREMWAGAKTTVRRGRGTRPVWVRGFPPFRQKKGERMGHGSFVEIQWDQ
jgi:hypothetical protein